MNNKPLKHIWIAEKGDLVKADAFYENPNAFVRATYDNVEMYVHRDALDKIESLEVLLDSAMETLYQIGHFCSHYEEDDLQLCDCSTRMSLNAEKEIAKIKKARLK